MKLCDLTQFYSPRSGGVKRYLHEKIAYIGAQTSDHEHVLIVPGAESAVCSSGHSRVYTIASPLVSRTTAYRALLDLRAVAQVIEREQPDLIESADPYQLGWKAAAIGRALHTPVVAFYHSDFAEAYLRPPAERFGKHVTRGVMTAAQAYARALYNRFEATLVPSPAVANQLRSSGVRNVRGTDLGVNTDVFHPKRGHNRAVRVRHDIPPGGKLLLYVGRLATEKNIKTLFNAISLVIKRVPGAFHLLVVGDGQERNRLLQLQASTRAVTWVPHAESEQLAEIYRAADLFVHPGVQETFGLVALESQACGTPVVGVRGSAMDRVILHDQETWARTNSAEALADAIINASMRDLGLMGATAARAVAERYAWPAVFNRLFCIYREVCADYTQRSAG